MFERVDSYTERLDRTLKTDPPKRKGERTRERIKLAAARVLEELGFHAMRVSDVTKAAGTSDGSFYIYFTDKKDVTLAVLREFLEGMQLAGSTPPQKAHDPFETIRHANLGWINAVKANAGLMRSVFQVSDEDPEFSELVHTSNREWYRRVSRSVVKKYPEGAADPAAIFFAAWALGGMMDEIIRRVVVYPDTEIVRFCEEHGLEDGALADALAVIWLRVLYPGHRVPDGLQGLPAALAALGGSDGRKV